MFVGLRSLPKTMWCARNGAMEKQDMEHILRILTLAEQSERIGILLGPEAGDTELLAAHALKDRLGEKAVILNAPDSLQDRWTHLFKKEHPKKETALAINVEQNPVEELRYEKNGGKLRIFLTSDEPITKDSFEVEERHQLSDMIIALGFTNQEDVARTIEHEAPLRTADALIRLSPLRAVLETSDGALGERLSLDAMKLWGRALLRSYIENDSHVFWAFLPKEDFIKTNQTPAILPRLAAHIERTGDIPSLLILLWQDPARADDVVHAMIFGKDTTRINELAAATSLASRTDNGVTLQPFANFSEAELAIRKLIKHAA